MQANCDNNNIVIRLLVSPRLRILRHLILIIFILSISASFIWYEHEQLPSTTALKKYGSLFVFASLFIILSYLNIYVLAPKFLLKNKWGLYFGSLSGQVAFIVITVILIQVIWDNGGIPDPINSHEYFYLILLINFLSGTQVFFLLFAGTSTFVVFKHWIQDMLQSEELKSATLQIELKLLENQINPHFLFNMLNNANIMIKKDADVAIHIIGKLEEMLGYLMNKSVQEKVLLTEEILFLGDYLELEKTRRDYFNYTVSKDGDLNNIQIAPLLFITFVENAVKHNQDSQSDSYVNISFKVSGNSLVFICVNSIPQKTPLRQSVGGIGLTNINRRLDLLYNGNYSLVHTKTDVNYTVKLELKL